jgi:hypothetical protein
MLELQVYQIVIGAVHTLHFPDKESCNQNKNDNVYPLSVLGKGNKAIKQESNNQEDKINAKNQGSDIYNS